MNSVDIQIFTEENPIPESVLDQVVTMYATIFGEDARSSSPHDQVNYTPEELREAARDSSHLVFALLRETKLQAFILVTTDLSRAPWVSPWYFQKRFPDYYQRGLIYYVTVVASYGGGAGQHLMRRLMSFVHLEKQGMVAYDYSRNKNSQLPVLINSAIRDHPEIIHEELDAEVYGVLHA